ncbi:MAG: hypothetical protein BJ554DRAFT_5859 [Olpidium bornovanus]|uniref:Saccharopine dehydrogenase NADP binding domain-containing protein n=1 Tax=Olpidium bornovanus TaxID=278681 RepID=A0A8H7ZZJ0_9FUNG|nr:MAG: hypothetical protein BJ554DRAFT_5859 [Olpidium bornovanus]
MPSSPTHRDLDLVVFGATGFTEHVAKTIGALGGRGAPPPRWAVAGRSEPRLQALARDVRAASLAAGSPEPHVVVAEVGDPASLEAMCRRTRVVINAVGPFRFFGEPRASSRAPITSMSQVQRLDGERSTLDADRACGLRPDVISFFFVLTATARRTGVLRAHAPHLPRTGSEDGRAGRPFRAIYEVRTPGKGCDPICDRDIKSSAPQGFGGNYATYESAVYGIGNAAELRKLRRQMKRPHLKQVGPPLKLKGVIAWDDRVQSWVVPFFFADPSVIRLTQCLEWELGPDCSSNDNAVPPVQFAAYILINSVVYLWLLAVFLAVFSFLATKPWGRSLLLKHPKLFSYGLFSRKGPSEEQIRATRFTSRFFAAGYSSEEAANSGKEPDVRLVTECSGPEPGYVWVPELSAKSAP